jgi:hypothetical protein
MTSQDFLGTAHRADEQKAQHLLRSVIPRSAVVQVVALGNAWSGGSRDVRRKVRPAGPDVIEQLPRTPRCPTLGVDELVGEDRHLGERPLHVAVVEVAGKQQRVGSLAEAVLLDR